MNDDILETAVDEPVEAEVTKTDTPTVQPTAGVPSTPAPGFWEQLKSFIRGEVEAANVVVKAADDKDPDEEEEETEIEVNMKKDETPVTKAADTVNLDALQAVQMAHLAQLEKVHNAQIEAVEKRLEEKYQAQLENLAQRVEKAEQLEKAATDARVKREFVEKAIAYRAIPMKADTLGDLLYKANKALDPADYDQLEALLKAADNHLAMASIFSEIGKAQTPEEVALEAKIEKAAAELNGDVGAALLSLSEAEQLELAAQMRGGK